MIELQENESNLFILPVILTPGFLITSLELEGYHLNKHLLKRYKKFDVRTL
jgi:hypothetical protein